MNKTCPPGSRSTRFLRSFCALMSCLLAALIVSHVPAKGADPLVNIQAGVKLSWPSVSGSSYRVQWAPTASGPWTDLGAAIPGTGTPLTAYDSAASGSRVYQIVETPPASLTVNIIPGNPQAMARITWTTTAGAQYQPETTDNLFSSNWTSVGPLITGDGNVKEVQLPVTGTPGFFRLRMPPVILPPSNVQSSTSGVANTIALSWTASTTSGVTGYRVLYGTTSGNLNKTVEFGNVTTGNIPGLEAGQVYYFAVVALTSSGQSVASSVISAQNNVTPLFSSFTALEPAITIDTPTALITKFSDRARDRHAREGAPADPVHDFKAYDHYLTFYWEERTISVVVTDTVGRGGSTVLFAYDHISPATITGGISKSNFRAWFRGIGTVAEYNDNRLVTIQSPQPSQPQVPPYHYETTITRNQNYNRALQVGDRIEIEISQFIDHPVNGRTNYYGTVLLYVVGQGIVPWYAGMDKDGSVDNPATTNLNERLDSWPMPQTAWMGGKVTLPYQYSNEPAERFKQHAGNISYINGQPFMLGRRLHHTDFGTGVHSEGGNPVFTEHMNQLGPKYIGRSCVTCHINNGRALPPATGAQMLQTVVKVGSNAAGAPHPTLGSVLQPRITSGTAEAGVTLASYTNTNGTYGDGTAYSLRKPNYTFTGVTPSFFSARLSPPLVGMGLLEAVNDADILALADPNDTNGDGISGRVSVVIDPETGEQRIGRFTSKGGRAKVKHQVAGALNTDMGVTTALFPTLDGDSSPSPVEVSADDLEKMTKYVSLLGVAAKRNLLDADVISGETLFATAGCAKCHVPTLTTSAYHPYAELRSQTIRPYSDLLLHDMGPGLADNMGEGVASGAEWRTAPLWSLGLTAGVSGGEAYLHDGRARTVEEAILWHGGEGEAAKEAFRTMTAAQRNAIVKFIKAL